MQLFTAIPKYYGDKTSIREERVERFRAAIKTTKMDPSRFVAHGAYVLNVGTPDAEKWTRARDGLVKELQRHHRIGLIGVVKELVRRVADEHRFAAAGLRRGLDRFDRINWRARRFVGNRRSAPTEHRTTDSTRSAQHGASGDD